MSDTFTSGAQKTHTIDYDFSKHDKKIEKRILEIKSRFGGDPVYSKYPIVESICLFFSKWYYNLTSGLFFKLKFLLQRQIRGYDDLDKWNAAWYISRKAIPVLTAMKSNFKGTSIRWHREDRFGNIVELTSDEVYSKDSLEAPVCLTEEEWKEVLEEIIFAFKFVLDEDEEFTYNYSQDQYEQRKKRHKRGLKLFSIYLMNLWD